MTSNLPIEIALPPEGTFMRDYALTSLMMINGYLHTTIGEAGYETQLSQQKYIIKGVSREDFCEALKAYYGIVLDIVNERQMQSPLIGRLHQNDKSAYKKALGQEARKETTYKDFFVKILNKTLKLLEEPDKCGYLLRELASIEVSRDYKEIRLGDKSISVLLPPLQPLKIEKYEYGKTFTSFRVKGDVKTTVNYLSLIASAWLLTYMGFYGRMVFAMPGNDTVINSLIKPEEYIHLMDVFATQRMDDLSRKLFGEKGYYSSVLRAVKAGSLDLEESYHVLHAIEIAEYISSGFMEPIRLIAINYDGRRFTLATDIEINPLAYAPIARKIAEMSKKTLNAVKWLAICASRAMGGIYDNTRCRENYGDASDAIRMMKLLYQALTGSADPSKTVYYLARLSPMSANKHVPPFRDPIIVNNLLYALRK